MATCVIPFVGYARLHILECAKGANQDLSLWLLYTETASPTTTEWSKPSICMKIAAQPLLKASL
jgi:hypothetical protein